MTESPKLSDRFAQQVANEANEVLENGYAGTKPRTRGDEPTDRTLVEQIRDGAQARDLNTVAEAYRQLEQSLNEEQAAAHEEASTRGLSGLGVVSGANRYTQNLREALASARTCKKIADGERANVRRNIVLADD